MAAITKKPSRGRDVEIPDIKPGPGLTKGSSNADRLRNLALRVSLVLKHVNDLTRLQIILILAEGEQQVGALGERLGQGQSAVSHHLALLRHGGVIAPRRQGKYNFYSLTETGVKLGDLVERLMTDGRQAGRTRPDPASPPPDRSARPNREETDISPDPDALLSDRRDDPHEEPWNVMNRRRAELIFKKNREGLDAAERPELERLQSISRARMQRGFQPPSLIDEKLDEIEERLRGGGIGEK